MSVVLKINENKSFELSSFIFIPFCRDLNCSCIKRFLLNRSNASSDLSSDCKFKTKLHSSNRSQSRNKLLKRTYFTEKWIPSLRDLNQLCQSCSMQKHVQTSSWFVMLVYFDTNFTGFIFFLRFFLENYSNFKIGYQSFWKTSRRWDLLFAQSFCERSCGASHRQIQLHQRFGDAKAYYLLHANSR